MTAPIWKLNPKKNRYEEVARCSYRRADHSLVVVEEKARVPAEMSPQFNLCAYLNDKELTMARYVGFRGLRIGDLDWEKIEPEKGKFQWKEIDSKIALAEQYGFRQEDMLFTLIGVPRWASSRPDSTHTASCSATPLSLWSALACNLPQATAAASAFSAMRTPSFLTPPIKTQTSTTPSN